MNRSFSLFLALRYLIPRRPFLFIITLISILGVALGIAALIVVISVMTGFDREMKNKIVGFDAHLFIVRPNDVMENWRALLPIVQGTPEVEAAAPFVFGPVVAEFGNKRAVPKVRGVDPAAEARVSGIGDPKMYREDGKDPKGVGGSFDLESGDNCVIGNELAHSLNCGVGDRITLYSPGNLNELMARLNELEKTGAKPEEVAGLRQAILPKEVTVAGIYSSGRFLYDNEFIFVPLYLGQELYGLGDAVHGLAARTVEPYRAAQVKEALESRLGDDADVGVQTWMEQNAQLFTTVYVERLTMFIILMFISVVAAFCVMITQITTTVLKTREIGIMKALGADTGQVIRVFVLQGMALAVLGVLLGVGGGLGAVAGRNGFKNWLANTFHLELFPARIYGLPEIPAYTSPSDLMWICVSTFLLCTLAALVPAYRAARLDPVKALRFE